MRFTTRDKEQVSKLANPLAAIAACCVGASALDKAALAQCVEAFESVVRWRASTTEADRRRAYGAAQAAQALATAPGVETVDTPRRRALAAYAASLGRFAMGHSDARAALVACDGAADIVTHA